jgi:hypothetical protein
MSDYDVSGNANESEAKRRTKATEVRNTENQRDKKVRDRHSYPGK